MTDFKGLQQINRQRYRAFTAQFDSYSDINLTSLLCWSPNAKCAIDDDTLVVLFEDYDSDGVILTGISHDAEALVEALVSLQRTIPNSNIDMLPGYIVENLRGDKTRFVVSREQADYLYRPSSQLELTGHNYAWHRRKLAQFKREVADYTLSYEHSEKTISENKLKDTWKKWKKISNPKEKDAIENYTGLYSCLENQTIVILRIKGVVEGFAFCELVDGTNSKDLVVHFFKSNPKYQGISDFLFYSIAEFAHTKGIDFINFEQDLGEEGLRYYKEHLVPDKLLEKYSLKRD